MGPVGEGRRWPELTAAESWARFATPCGCPTCGGSSLATACRSRANWLAPSLVVYAVGAGGAALVAVYAAVRTVAGMGVVLVLTGFTSRLRRDRLLRWITGVRAVLLAAAALLAALGQPSAAVIAAGAASSSLAGTYRPLQAAVLPWLVRTPAELAASNAVTAVMENAGALIGPLLAGGVLAVASPAAAMAVAAGCLAAATVSLLRLAVPDTPKARARGAASVTRDITSGLAEFWRMAPPGGVAILAFAQTLLRGALVVLIAVLAVRVLGLGGSAVGWLNAALGAGGLAGAALAAAAVRVTRLGRSFIAGMLLWGLPLALLALSPAATLAYLALVIVGIGNAVVDVSGFTLVTRLAGPGTAGKALGALEFAALAGLATGSILAPPCWTRPASAAPSPCWAAGLWFSPWPMPPGSGAWTGRCPRPARRPRCFTTCRCSRRCRWR
jgi:hypothetical protein